MGMMTTGSGNPLVNTLNQIIPKPITTSSSSPAMWQGTQGSTQNITPQFKGYTFDPSSGLYKNDKGQNFQATYGQPQGTSSVGWYMTPATTIRSGKGSVASNPMLGMYGTGIKGRINPPQQAELQPFTPAFNPGSTPPGPVDVYKPTFQNYVNAPTDVSGTPNVPSVPPIQQDVNNYVPQPVNGLPLNNDASYNAVKNILKQWSTDTNNPNMAQITEAPINTFKNPKG